MAWWPTIHPRYSDFKLVVEALCSYSTMLCVFSCLTQRPSTAFTGDAQFSTQSYNPGLAGYVRFHTLPQLASSENDRSTPKQCILNSTSTRSGHALHLSLPPSHSQMLPNSPRSKRFNLVLPHLLLVPVSAPPELLRLNNVTVQTPCSDALSPPTSTRIPMLPATPLPKYQCWIIAYLCQCVQVPFSPTLYYFYPTLR